MLAKETQTSAELLQFRSTSFLLQLEQLISSCFGSEVLLCLSEELAHSSFIELLIMAWLSTVDDVTLIAISKTLCKLLCFDADSWNMQTYLHYLDEEATAISLG